MPEPEAPSGPTRQVVASTYRGAQAGEIGNLTVGVLTMGTNTGGNCTGNVMLIRMTCTLQPGRLGAELVAHQSQSQTAKSA
jgi:hypothetical protein